MKKLILPVIIVAAIAATSCSSSKETANAPAPVASPSSSEAPAATSSNSAAPEDFVPLDPGKFTAGADPKGDVVFATRKQMTATQWSVTVSSSSPEVPSMTMEHVAPDRYHVRRSDGEVIIIGSKTFVSQGGQWKKIPDDLSKSIGNASMFVTEESLSQIQNVRKVREEKVGAKDAVVYQYDAKDDEAGVSSTSTVWLEKESGLPLKIEIDGKSGGKSIKITSVYDYDKKVDIQAPKGVE